MVVPDLENRPLTGAIVVRDPTTKQLKPGGASLNPGGRPALSPEVKEMLRARTVDAVTTLVGIMTDTKAKAADRIRAAEAFLDRALGRPQQAVALTGEDGAPIAIDMRAGLLAAVTKLVEPK